MINFGFCQLLTKLNFSNKNYCYIVLIYIFSLHCNAFADTSPFQKFDNNFMLGASTLSSPGNYWASSLNLKGEALFDNGLWLELPASTKLTYSVDNNKDTSISKTLNNSAGSSIGLSAGYAFLIGNNYNIIPYVGFAYRNQLLAVNEDSIQQFIIEDPSFNWSVGFKNELIAIPQKLKFSVNAGFNYGSHNAVIPDSLDNNMLGHFDYTQYTLSVSPAVQWNFSERFTLVGYYQLNYNFSDTQNIPGIPYSQMNVNTDQYLMTNYVQNILGISIGILF